MSSTQTIVHRAANAAAFLASVPHLIGFQPEQSVVMIPFQDRRSCGAVRFDLPRGEPAVAVDLFVGTLCRFEVAETVRVVVYSRGGIGSAGPLPESELAHALLARLRAVGFRAQEAWCVGADGWAEYAGEDPERHALEELSGAAGELSDAVPLRSVAERATLPELPAGVVAEVRAEVDALLDAHPSAELPEEDRAEAIGAVGRAARGSTASLEPRAVARFIVLVQRLDRRRELLLEALWAGDRRAQARQTPPPATQVQHVIVFAAHAAACAAPTEMPAALGFLAIAHWAAGRGSVAAIVIERALQLDPHDANLRALLQMLDAGITPPWRLIDEAAS